MKAGKCIPNILLISKVIIKINNAMKFIEEKRFTMKYCLFSRYILSLKSSCFLSFIISKKQKDKIINKDI